MTVQFMGRDYAIGDLLKEGVAFGDSLVVAMRVLGTARALPAGTDYTADEDKKIHEQIQALSVLPDFLRSSIWTAFAANHLPKVADMVHALDIKTQRRAMSTAIQVLALLQDPKVDPYFRRFLLSPKCVGDPGTQSQGLPTAVAHAIAIGVSYCETAGPREMASLLIHFLQWCPPSVGDDGRASINAAERHELIKTMSVISNALAGRGRQDIEMEVQRLIQMLKSADSVAGPSGSPDGYFFTSQKEYLSSQTDICSGKNCPEEPEHRCTGCKAYRYCGTACQKWHWKNGHKLMCFKTDF